MMTINQTRAELTPDQDLALNRCLKILEEAFDKTMFKITVRPVTQQPEKVYGVSFCFDLTQKE